MTKEKPQKRADFCSKTCPACRHAGEKGKGLAHKLVKMEAKYRPYCRACADVYGKPAYEREKFKGEYR